MIIVQIGERYERGNIVASRFRQERINVPVSRSVGPGPLQRLIHIAGAVIIGSHHERPVVVDIVKILHIATGGGRRLHRIAPGVDHRNEFQLQRQAVFGQFVLDHREVVLSVAEHPAGHRFMGRRVSHNMFLNDVVIRQVDRRNHVFEPRPANVVGNGRHRGQVARGIEFDVVPQVVPERLVDIGRPPTCDDRVVNGRRTDDVELLPGIRLGLSEQREERQDQ